MKLTPSRKACDMLGIHPNTLRKWADNGTIKHVRTKAGQRLYDVESITGQGTGRKICYCRVSSAKQRDDLGRQIKSLRDAFPNHEIISDIGSGLNFKRKGLTALLEAVCRGDVREVVVAHRDRLARFGFDLIKWLIEHHGGKLVVLGTDNCSPESELVHDLLAIVNVFSCRMHGLRKYKSQIKSQIKEDRSLPGPGTGRTSSPVGGNGPVCVQSDRGILEAAGHESQLESDQDRDSSPLAGVGEKYAVPG